MQSNLNSLWWPRGLTFVVSALVALSVTFWVLKGASSATPSGATPAALAGAQVPSIDPQMVALALGGGKQPVASDAPPASSRFVLTGVVADPSKGGAALIAVDGKPPKAVRVGGTVDESLVLKSVSGRRAELAPDMQSAATVSLELPPLAK
jgi:general secretion pathway protein C